MRILPLPYIPVINISAHIEDMYQGFSLKSQKDYIKFHKKRYHYIINRIGSLLSTELQGNKCSILDVGPAYQTTLLRKCFTEVQINTVGYTHDGNQLREDEVHLTVNLNETDQYEGSYPQHDIILFAEVIEHLYTRPQVVLAFLTKFLRSGGFVIIQTPNAAATFKRLQLLCGHHPYELIQENRMGHYREYTRSELRVILDEAGFDIHSLELHNYFNYHKHSYQKIYKVINSIMPRPFKDGITVIGKKR